MRDFTRLLVVAGLMAGFFMAAAPAQASPYDGTRQRQKFVGSTFTYETIWAFRGSNHDQVGCEVKLTNNHSITQKIKVRYVSQGGTEWWETATIWVSPGASYYSTFIRTFGYKPQSVQPQTRFYYQNLDTNEWIFARALNPAALNGSTMQWLANSVGC